MLEWIERRLKSAYLKLLEDEVARLREENRQLVNSILNSHGMAGVDAPRSQKTFEPIKRKSWTDIKRKFERAHMTPVQFRTDGTPEAPAPPEGKAAIAR